MTTMTVLVIGNDYSGDLEIPWEQTLQIDSKQLTNLTALNKDKYITAISSVIIVGAIIAGLAGDSESVFNTSSIFGFLAISLAAINIFGGFLVTQRMLAMYKKKKKDK